MILNNLYNFKNPVKNFLDIDSMKFPEDISNFDIKNLSWAEPVNFRVKKKNKHRTLKMPNILNFVAAYEHFKDISSFGSIQDMDPSHKRLSANIETGDFLSGEYERHLEEDFNRLCIYDQLIKMDIKEYYGRIYTHLIDYEAHDERYLSNMNLGKTNGLIMGNYLSLYFAESNLKNISNDIQSKITRAGIECEFSYFSDDFYFFCNKSDADKVIIIFDKVLEKYELERNDNKEEIWTYETFNNYNLVARYWKKIIAHCNVRYNRESEDNKLYFINQLVFRISNLDDEKLKIVFINNFFKTKYFRELDLETFQVKEYDYHQLCFLLSLSPESLLYSIDKFSNMSSFENQNLKKFLKVRYKQALQKLFNEEQLYYYYAIKTLDFTDILINTKEAVLKSNNQLLISYYLSDELFVEEEINILKNNDDERFWFQNYHLILYSPELLSNLEASIDRYLIPKRAIKERQKNAYKEFYTQNLQLEIPIIRDIPSVLDEIKDYLELRIEEMEIDFDDQED
ncbi:hypothetical protein CEQ21_07645 (plasmid) [Niallia circulans]|uniref:Reverse transcriptase domain-containing protein n=1 Tax=Niallia circulans TaxID=1397 RepID=A0A553SQG2_NIACI|nr:hypothetical protein [Niallia circulans]TRZ39233.1 hypothetical protein CEQ21_07645 [Niallia circulans]